MDDFKYFKCIMKCLNSDCIKFNPVFNNPINDLPCFVLQTSSLPLTMYAVHQLLYPNVEFREMKCAVSNTGITYFYNEHFIQVPISNKDAMNTIQFIKNIIQQPHTSTYRHTIVLMFTETLKHHYANACNSIINKYLKTTLFVLAQHPHGKIPFCIQNGNVLIKASMDCEKILHAIGMNHMVGELSHLVCPLELCAMLEQYPKADEFILKGIKKLSCFQSATAEYLICIRDFALKILASGIPIPKFATILNDLKPDDIQLISGFEHRMLSSNKQLFLLEHFLMQFTRPIP